MKSPIAILRLLLAFALLGCAQAAPERTCRIVFPDRPQEAPKSLQLFDGKTCREVELPSMNLSPVYGLASGAIQLKLLGAEVEDPKDVPADAPSVEVPADCADLILLVSGDPDNKTAPVKLELVDLGSEYFKVGQTLWANRSDKAIEAKLGEQTVSLEPESSNKRERGADEWLLQYDIHLSDPGKRSLRADHGAAMVARREQQASRVHRQHRRQAAENPFLPRLPGSCAVRIKGRHEEFFPSTSCSGSGEYGCR